MRIGQGFSHREGLAVPLDRAIRPGLIIHAFEGPEPDVRTMLERIVFTKEVWTAAIGGRDIPKDGERTIAEPPEAKARPASGYHAAFSGPCTVAAALLGGGLGVSREDFTDAAARDPRRLALAALVRCVEDERCSASFPHAFPASCA